MMKKSNNYKASITLGAVTVGYFLSYPFSQSFWGGLVTSGCQAAMVGGLADWFAVTALFKKPLGISFRTNLISRNRERIFQDLVDVVQDSLLTKENIIAELEQHNFADYLLEYLEQHGGKEGIKAVLRKISNDIVLQLEPHEIGDIIGQLLKNHAERIRLAPVLIQMIQWSIQSGYGAKVVDYLLIEMSAFVQRAETRQFIEKLISEALRAYEKKNAGRKWVSNLLDISPSRLAQLAQTEITEFLCRIQGAEHPLRLQGIQWLEELAFSLQNDTQLQEQVERWKLETLQKVDIRGAIVGFILFLRQKESRRSEALRTFKWLNQQVDDMTTKLRASKEQQHKMDAGIKRIMSGLLDQYHPQIGMTVQSALAKYTDDRLVGFIENKVGNDLQMIRINGSIVGGLVGIGIYLLTYWI